MKVRHLSRWRPAGFAGLRERSYVLCAVVAMVVAASAGAVHADTLTWTGANNTTTNWSDATKWSSDGSHTFPQVGDTAQFLVNIDNWTTLEIQGGASVGSITIKPRWGPYRIKTGWGGSPIFTFNNNDSTSVVTLDNHAGAGQTNTNLVLGADGNAMRMSLANDLLVQNAASSVNNGVFAIGNKVTITGGTALARRTITTKAISNRKITMSVSAAGATFIGDWVVDGANATLDMNSNAFGDASNSVTLVNGGVLDLDTLGAVSWTRALHGDGTVKAAGGLTLDTGSFNFVGDGAGVGALSITGALTLGGGSILNVTGALDPGDYTLVSASGGVNGTFASWSLPSGASLVYGSDSITLHVVVPEPAGIGLVVLGGLTIATPRRRARQWMSASTLQKSHVSS